MQGSALLKDVTIDGQPVSTLYDRWQPTALVPLSEDATCLTLAEPESGRHAVWYLNAQKRYCGSHIEVTEHLSADDVLAPLAPIFDELARTSLATLPPAAPPEMATIPPFLAIELASAWVVRNLANTAIVPVSRPESDGTVSGPNGLAISNASLHRMLESRLGDGPLIVPSPFTGAPLRTQLSFALDHLLIHRFYDPEQKAAFYLIWPERDRDRKAIFYSPLSRLIVSDLPGAGLIPGRILGWYLSHPEHVRAVAEAPIFEARDYGLGQASKLKDGPAQSSAEQMPPRQPHGEAISDSWTFLRETAAGKTSSAALLPSTKAPEPITSRKTGQESGLLGRLRSFFQKK